MWRIGTNSSYGCEIYEMRNLRFNRDTIMEFLFAFQPTESFFNKSLS